MKQNKQTNEQNLSGFRAVVYHMNTGSTIKQDFDKKMRRLSRPLFSFKEQRSYQE